MTTKESLIKKIAEAKSIQEVDALMDRWDAQLPSNSDCLDDLVFELIKGAYKRGFEAGWTACGERIAEALIDGV